MTSSWFRRLGALNAIFNDWFWKSDHDFLMAFYTNFLSRMHGFRDNEVSLQDGYDVIVISTLGSASGEFSRRILKERPWVPDTNFLSRMHGFRDNKFLLPTGNDVIVISLLGDVSHRFCWQYLKEWPRFHNHGSLTYFAFLLPFRSYSTFHFWLPIAYSDQF